MSKRNISQAFIDSDDSSDAAKDEDLDNEMLSLSKKNKNQASPGGAGIKKVKQSAYSQSSSDSDSDWGAKSKGKKLKKKKKVGMRSIRRSISAGSSSDEVDENDERNAADVGGQDNNMAPAKKEDLEEGEVDDDSDESDSSEFNDGYDDNLMGDDEDKRRLNSMTEKEREQEIFKRIEQREIMKTRYDIEKKLRQAKKKESKRQRKAESGSTGSKFKMDAKERSKERKKTVEAKIDKKSQAMDMLKAKREAKRERQEEKEKQRIEQELNREDNDGTDDIETKSTVTEKSSSGIKKKLKASDIYSDDSASDYDNSTTHRVKREPNASSSDSDSDDDDRSTGKPVEYVDSVEDLNKMRLSRSKIEKWVYCPFFNRVAKGCFVRVGIGYTNEKPCYQVAEVIDVVETARTYSLGSVRTNKGLTLRHGTSERVFRLEYISQADFQDSEFKRWKEICDTIGVLRPTMDDMHKKVQELTEAYNYEFKEEDIEHIVNEKMRFKNAPVNFAVKKTQLMKEKENAQQRGDEKRVEDLSREIADLDDRAKELDKERSKSISSIGYINQRNRKKNVEQAERAIMEEVLANKGKKTEDPFTRRNTRPTVVHRPTTHANQDAIDGDIKDIKLEPASTSADEDVVSSLHDNTEEAKKILDDLNLDEVKTTSDMIEAEIKGKGMGKPLTTGDLFHAHDFDIKLDLDEKVILPNLPIVARAIIPPQVREMAPRRSLNLEDYKRKRGLI